MAGILGLLMSGAGLIKDQYFNLTTLLLPGNGTNGAQNNTFIDGSTNNFTITRNGNTTQGTFSPFSQTGWGCAFNTSTTYLTVTDTANLRFGSANFTIEAWVYRNASGATQTIASKGASTPTGWVFQISSADKLVFTDTSTSITGATSIAANTWTYVAVVRAGTGTNQTTLYVNGTSDGTGTSATNFNQTSNMLIGADRSTTNFANGYISNLRLSNTNRTISSTPTTALTADANTIFLSLNSNRFQYTDSTAAYTDISATGTPSVVAFSPFAPTAAYSASAVGGSGYFDGTGDYLSFASNALLSPGSGDFTIEAWIYPATSYSTYNAIYSPGSTTNGMFFGKITGGIGIRAVNTGDIISATAPSINQWVHVAVSRSGTSMRIFFNGVQQGSTVTDSTNFATSAIYVGDDGAGSANWNGYISNLRFVKGTAVYTGNFTPPTAPLTAITNTSLLLNFTNAGIYDATSKNDLETVGNAQISTAISAKWGSGSIYFNGSASYLQGPNSINANFSGGDFTIEFWMYASAQVLTPIVHQTSYASSLGWIVWNFDGSNPATSTRKLTFMANGASFTLTTSSDAYVDNTWTYIAVVKSGTGTGNIKIYSNGTAIATGTYATALNDATQPLMVGGIINGVSWNSTAYYTGYIQDLRITKGYARTITASPSAPFPKQ